MPGCEVNTRLLNARFGYFECFGGWLFAQQGKSRLCCFEVGNFPSDFLFSVCLSRSQIAIVELGDGLTSYDGVAGFYEDFVDVLTHGRIDKYFVSGFDNALSHYNIVNLDQCKGEYNGPNHTEDPEYPFDNSAFSATAHHGIIFFLLLDRFWQNGIFYDSQPKFWMGA